ncbi:MAG: acylphosphatase, partial [Rothia dentocariosa]|nr:acylphosphatase [Rothia dentocariosa]
NLDDGRVKVIAQGTRASCERLLDALNSGDTAGHVDFVDATFSEPQGAFKGFGIR